ncbi:hypothetical protein MTR67_023190 [Solanum verrucosum]|uniref:Uncharacterized protein n=1 Tax=Solanum verrucosum TaxID=315347 RepID=A0AAF0QZ94_SOLVR|nr:hypothetical protein MTR67_023190 [Solanum verrucosum]
MCMEGACPRRGLSPPRAKSLVLIADLPQTLLFQKLIPETYGNTSASRTSFPTKFVKIKLKFDLFKRFN